MLKIKNLRYTVKVVKAISFWLENESAKLVVTWNKRSCSSEFSSQKLIVFSAIPVEKFEWEK